MVLGFFSIPYYRLSDIQKKNIRDILQDYDITLHLNKAGTYGDLDMFYLMPDDMMIEFYPGDGKKYKHFKNEEKWSSRIKTNKVFDSSIRNRRIVERSDILIFDSRKSYENVKRLIDEKENVKGFIFSIDGGTEMI